MGWTGKLARRSAAVAVAAGLAAGAAAAPPAEEQLWHHRNLGKAFYENPATQYEAVGEFKRALELAPDSARERVNYGLALLRAGKADEGIAELERAQQQDPSIPHTWFNLGIAYKQKSEYKKAIAQLEGMLERVPDEPITHYNLGVLYKLDNDADKALHHFERAARLDPNLAGPHFQLSTAYRQAKRADEAQREMELFREIKKRDADAAVPEDLEWSYYSEIYETRDRESVRQAGEGAEPAALSFVPQQLATGLDPATAGLAVLDGDGDGGSDLLVFSAAGIQLYAGGAKAAASGLEGVRGVRAVAPGDFDNDGLADLCVLAGDGAALYRNAGKLRFEKHAAALPAGEFRTAVWLDADHDDDLDLILLGKDAALVRNDGSAGFSDRTADFPFVEGEALAAVRLDLVADTQGMDLAVLYAARKGVLYRDLLAGKYEPHLLSEAPPGMTAAVAHDVDHDGWTDLTVADGQRTLVLRNDHRGAFKQAAAPTGAPPILYADFANRGVSELVTGAGVHRNRGLGEVAAPAAPVGWPKTVAAAVAADFDADGRLDLAAVDGAGTASVLRNQTADLGRWLRIRLEGVKNPLLAPGAEVEVKAGASYQKKVYDGTPLHFGLGDFAQVDAVRITWPNGLIQNEARQSVGQAAAYKEAQRLSGSCPMVYTWNGEEFEFITDVLGVAPLGAAAGDGEYFSVDHDEVIQIPGEALRAEGGRYEVRIVEELREVAYFDEVRLLAVDHPETVDVFINDKFKGPPFPEFRLYGVAERVYPRQVRDHRGADVTARVAARDETYPDGFARDLAGIAELHHLDFDFGAAAPENRAVLVLHGWVDWADGSTFRRASQQADGGLVMPYLQVKDAAGEWRTVIEDMGMPAGKPKTIVVDLSGKFLSASREVRIVTNLCVYWDEVFLSPDTAPPAAVVSDLHPALAELRFGGFSRVVVHPERRQPERFVYAERRSTAMWNPTPGLYTRYGDVRPLLTRIDDRLLIMGSGDELRLLFDAQGLPPLAPGWRRDFLLFVDGWAKDGDPNTAHSQTVAPLPYHGMAQYPYAAPDAFPDGELHRRYLEEYVTRPALRLIRPLYDEAPGRRSAP